MLFPAPETGGNFAHQRTIHKLLLYTHFPSFLCLSSLFLFTTCVHHGLAIAAVAHAIGECIAAAQFARLRRSSEDLSPNFERNVSFYDRNTRLTESSSDMYIRRPNNYHHSESRGRPRDRHYRNGSYSSQLDRTNSSILHRQSSNAWYENSTAAAGQSTRYGSGGGGVGLASAAVVATPDSAYDTTTDRRTSETECSSKSTVSKKKTRSGSESPCAER